MIARQPVYNNQMGVFGYELLFRPPADGKRYKSGEATAHVLSAAVLGTGLDELVYKRQAIINITRAYVEVMPQMQLPPTQVVLDLPDNIQSDPKLLANLSGLREMGFSLSVGGLSTLKDQRLLSIADNYRVDVKKVNSEQLGKLTRYLRRFGNLSLRALKIESLDEYDLYCGAGFDYFQGYFLGSPRVHKVRELSVARVAIMDLLAAANNLDTSVEKLEEKIVRDVSLSFKLLKLVNSPFFGVPQEVDSVKRAVVLLGRDEIRKLVSLLALSGSSDGPPAAIEIALQRARICELLAEKAGMSSESFFTVGMFSALDVLMEQPINAIIAKLPLSDVVKDAILERSGLLGEALSCALAIENARWSEMHFAGLDDQDLAAVSREAMQWTHSVVDHI